MDGTFLIAGGIVLFIIIIIILFVVSTKKQRIKSEQQLENLLHELAQIYKLDIGEKELIGKRVIALDKQKTTLIFIDEHTKATDVIQLHDITGCIVLKEGVKFNTRGGNGKPAIEEHVNSIHLELHLKGGVNLILPFYTEIQDGIMEMLPLKQKAEKWKNIIVSS